MAQATIARSGWDFEVERGPDWLFVRPRKIGDGSAASFAEQVGALLDQQFTHRLVLELGDVGQFTSELADQLIGLHKRIQLQDGLMRVCELTEVQEDVLHARCSESHFSRYRTREDAVMGHARPRQPR
jgi:anti-anti-sigma regulatory factor